MITARYVSNDSSSQGKIKSSLDKESVKIYSLLERAEIPWDMSQTEIDHKTYEGRMRNEMVFNENEVGISLRYDFNSSYAETQEIMEDLWRIYVETILEKVDGVEN